MNNRCQVRKERTSASWRRTVVAAGLASLVLVTAGCSGSEDDRIMVSAESPPALNAREATAVSLAATKVLHEASRARQALQREVPKPEEAIRRVEQGLTLIHIIENTVPWTRVKTEIQAGDLVYRDDDADGRLFIPISDSLLALDELIPADSGAAAADSAPAPATAADAEPGEDLPLVERSELGYVALFLDVSLAKEKLEAAATGLRADETEAAKEALLAVQTDGVVFQRARIELPLEEAAANLKLAEYEVSEGRADAAAVNLAAGAEALKLYELDDGRHADEARQMHAEIETLVESLAEATGSAHGRGEVEETIASWWKSIASWLGPNG